MPRRKGWRPPGSSAPTANTAASLITHAEDNAWLEGWHMFIAGLPAPEDLRSQGWHAACASAAADGPFSQARKAESLNWLKSKPPLGAKINPLTPTQSHGIIILRTGVTFMSIRKPHIQTPKSRRLDYVKAHTLPSHIVLLWNKVRKARKPHTLKCACVVQPGEYYHSCGMKIKGKIAYAKSHALEACPQTRVH